jgi:maltodextrin utilization protein YvdJ
MVMVVTKEISMVIVVTKEVSMVIVVTKGVPVLVGLILGLHHGDSHILGSQLNGQTTKWLK